MKTSKTILLGTALLSNLAALVIQTHAAHGMTRPSLAVPLNAADAVYPIRIDPTFSDTTATNP